MMSDEEQENGETDLFEEQLYKKIESYFSSNNDELLSYEKLDDFLQAIDLCQWDSEEEKDVLWQSLMKYNINKKVDKDGAMKGLHYFLTQEDDNSLTRLSRITIKNDGTGTMNKLVLNKYKQKAIDEYECLDDSTLIQFMKIFVLLNINENNINNAIRIEKIEEICNKHKFITLEPNEIIKYLSYLTCDNTPLEEIKTIEINMEIFNDIDALLQEKLGDEDIDNFDDDDEEGKKDDPLDILEDVIQKINRNNK